MRTTFLPRTSAVIGVAGLLVLGTASPGFAAVGADQAGQIVVDRFGGQIKSVESDSENGQPTWEVELEASPQYGRIELDVAKSSGEVIACEPEDGQGTCPADLSTGDAGATGQVDDNDGDGDVDGDDVAGESGDRNGDGEVDGADAAVGGPQVSPMPDGGADTGVSGTPADKGVFGDAAALAFASGTVLLIAGGGLMWLRDRRTGKLS